MGNHPRATDGQQTQTDRSWTDSKSISGLSVIQALTLQEGLAKKSGGRRALGAVDPRLWLHSLAVLLLWGCQQMGCLMATK